MFIAGLKRRQNTCLPGEKTLGGRESAVPGLFMTELLIPSDPAEWQRIGSILGSDHITEVHIINLFLAHNIQPAIGGSRTYSIDVPQALAEQATQLLRKEAQRGDYYIWLAGEEVVPAPELREVARGISVASLLKNADYCSETALGRLLRTDRLSQLVAAYPYMSSLRSHERRYLATPKTHSTGYDVRFELHKSARKRADGCMGWCQLLDNGREVKFWGGVSEWQFGRC
jgi:hypothetical protein